MEIFKNEIFLMVLSSIFIIFTLYLFILLKIKRKEGKNLYKENLSLIESIGLKKNILDELAEKLETKKKELKALIELEKNETALREIFDKTTEELHNINNRIDELKRTEIERKSSLLSIEEDISIYLPVHDLMEIGFFEEPDYLFETSERFKEEIKSIRENQKQMIKNNTAIFIPDKLAFTSNTTYVKKILNGQCRLMLKAFNVECDKLMSMVKPSNYPKILERIDKVAGELEKSAISLDCGFTKEFVSLKFKECELQYQFKLKDEREKEEQAIIKEQMREEQKAIREFERALEKAQREEKMYKTALEDAKKELLIVGEKDKLKLEERILLLEKQLIEAENNEQRAKSMAEQTKRGHVYIISNIGSFGENIYKIGLTRRLEPMDRVKELGDASVPFIFDVHAMIFSEDAPALERQLHNEFTGLRVNQVNFRKEFFNVTLDDIKDKAIEIMGEEIDFKMTALAEDYYESQKLRSVTV